MRFVILLFLVASFCLNAQSDRGHYIGINFSPARTYMSNVNPILGPPALFHSNPYFGGSAGVSTLWDIHPRLKLQTDILYSVYSETQSRIVTNQKLSFPEGTEIAYLKIEYHSLSIPVLLNYYFYKGRWSWFVQSGLRGHIFLNRYLTMPFGRSNIEDRVRERIEDTGKYANAPLAISCQIGFGVEYTNSKNFKLRMSPFFENFLVSTYKNPEALEVPFAYGFTVGAYWNVF